MAIVRVLAHDSGKARSFENAIIAQATKAAAGSDKIIAIPTIEPTLG